MIVTFKHNGQPTTGTVIAETDDSYKVEYVYKVGNPPYMSQKTHRITIKKSKVIKEE